MNGKLLDRMTFEGNVRGCMLPTHYDDDGLIADVVDVEMRLPTMAFCLVVVCFCQFGVFSLCFIPRMGADVYVY